MRRAAGGLLVALLMFGAAPRSAVPDDEVAWFKNVAKEVGLEDVKAKDCIFADLNGDGYWDLCLDRQRFFLSSDGKRFEAFEKHGIAYPLIHRVLLDKNGQPDEAKAKDGPYVPHYLYFADLDNDGDQDAVWGVKSWWEVDAGRAWRSVKACDPGVRTTVWLNDGKGRYKQAPASGISAKDAYGPVMALAICDTDSDGRLDLFEGREYRRYGVLYGCGVDRLWRGEGKGRFTDITKKAGLLTVPEPGGTRSSRPTYGVTHCDWNNDGHQDLMALSYGRQWNYLWHNNGDGTFQDLGVNTGFAGDQISHGRYPPGARRRPEAPFRSNGNTFDCAIGDLDNDGDLDCLLGEIAHAWAGEASDMPSFLINQGERGHYKFERLTVREMLPLRDFRNERNWNYGDLHTAFLDVDNDGRLDVLIGSGDYPDGQFLRLYHQQEDGEFEEVTKEAAFDWEGCGDLSIGDFDRDGDVDILAGRSFMRLNQAHRDRFMGGIKVNAVGLFRNDIANRTGNHWLNVRLEGKGKGGANRSGIGARIWVHAGGVRQMREIRSGSGLSNHQDPPEACFGLGKAEVIESLEVRWPNKKHTVQRFKNVPVDKFVVIREGKSKLVFRSQ